VRLLKARAIARVTLPSNAKKLAMQTRKNAATIAIGQSGPINPAAPNNRIVQSNLVAQNSRVVQNNQIAQNSPAAQSNPAVPSSRAVQNNPGAPNSLAAQISRAAPIARILGNRRVRSSWLLASCWFVSFSVSGQSPDANALFAQGRSAFERQDFAAALESFEAALAAQLQGPAVHYNIGVAAYRLQRFERARIAFLEAARTPAMAGLAHYNLGLVAQAQGDERVASDEFARAYAASSDERVRSLARTQLDALGAAPPDRRPTWLGFAATGIGYDDNVTLSANGQSFGIAREDDVYGDTQLVGSLSLSPSWRIDGDASLLNYADLNEFDQWGLGAGARYRTTLDAWTMDSGAHFSTSYLDGDRFEARQAIYVQAARAIDPSLTLRTRYRFSNVAGTDRYPGFDGQRHELSARLMKAKGWWSASVTYLFDQSDYESDALSAARHQLSADARAFFTTRWSGRVALSYRQSDYEDPTIDSETRIECAFVAERALTERLTAVVQYSFTDNESDFAWYAYRRNRVFAGIEAIF
jgi:tetratricopeptide (TPR) repeat protein